MRILIVEDEANLAAVIQRGLEGQGYQAPLAESGEDAILFVRAEPVDLVLLDIGLPDLDGHAVLAHLLRLRRDLPVITVTARDDIPSKVVELEDRQPAVAEPAHPIPLDRVAGAIAVEDVRHRYPGGDRDALAGVSFTLAPGETLALVGQSGAGKSTATRLLLRLDDPSAGTIRLDGHDLRDVSIHDLRQNVTVLPQEALFFDVPVREAIAYGRPGATEEEIVAAAKMAGAHDFIDRLPEGYGTRVGQRGRSLSGGQRQRLSIARALLRDAPVLVLDEPTTGLDNENAAQILATIRSLMAGRTTIIVSHDLNLVRQATRIVVLDRGRVVEEGAHEEPMAAGGLYARLALALESREADGGRRKSRSRGVEKRRRKVTSRDLRRAGVLA
jgi:ABC-type multidrug transport system fused ATPase/permease subunit